MRFCDGVYHGNVSYATRICESPHFLSGGQAVIRVKLREAMEAHRLRTGERLTYTGLAEMSGVGEGTLSSIGSRVGYNVTLATVERIRRALDVPLHDLLEVIDDPPKPKRRAKKKRPGGTVKR